MRAVLTPCGKERVLWYLSELEAKRKEILDAKQDTADDTELPGVEDIVSDIPWCSEEADDRSYCNNWNVTDHYVGDSPLELEYGTDFVLKGE